MLDGKVILVTGGTGSFGRRFVKAAVARTRPARVIVFSRDEYKQLEMSEELRPDVHPCLRYVLGDVRDAAALSRVMDGVDFVVHTAALKQIPAGERNALEVIKTNVLGAANVVDAAIERHVDKVIALSSDKAANPVNLYGASKLCSDKLILSGNEAERGATRFSVVRYGNVLGSRGSVVPRFLALRATGSLPVTDPRMTRFWITLSDGVDFTLSCIERMHGGEVFVPKAPSMSIVDLATAIAPECVTEVVGIRPGEKLHEVLISTEDAERTIEYEDRFVILPQSPIQGNGWLDGGHPCPPDFSYTSDHNSRWMSVEELRSVLEAPM